MFFGEFGIVAFAVIIFIAPFVLAIVAMNKAERISREMFKLRQEIAQLKSDLMQGAFAGTAPAQSQPAAEVPEPEKPAPQEDPAETSPLKVDNDDDSVASEPDSKPSEQPVAARASLEEKLTGRWLIWIGAVAIALAGLFLVKLMADAGLLGPGARILLGLFGGAALAAAGEWLRRRPSQQKIAETRTDFVPQAMTAGGLAAVFASIYAASALYGFIGPWVTFIGLGLAALAAFGLSVVQGPLVAIVGLIGGFVLPVLIGSSDPFAPGLFVYLGILFAAISAVLVWRPAMWLAVSGVVLACGWVFLWSTAFFEKGDGITLALFSGLIATGIAIAGTIADRHEPCALWVKPFDAPKPVYMALVGGVAGALLLQLVLLVDGFDTGALLGLVIFAVVSAYIASQAIRYDFLAVVAGVAIVCAFALWGNQFAVTVWMRDYLPVKEFEFDDWQAQQVASYVRYAAGFGVAALVSGYLLLWRSERPWVWATIAFVVPTGLLIAAFAGLGVQWPTHYWGAVALVLAAVYAALAGRMRAYAMAHDHMRLALGIVAMAVCASIAMAMAFVLRDAWLSVALAALLAATGHIARELQLPQLRWPALIIAVAVVVRLGLNIHVLDYDDTQWLGRYWVIYGYGVPLVMFHLAYVFFGKREAGDLLAKVLEGGRIALFTLFISALIRVVVAGRLGSSRLGLWEAGLHITSWLISATACWWRWSLHGGFVDKWAGRVLVGLASIVLVLGPMLLVNPLFDRQMVGNFPLINALIPAYLLPGILIALIGYMLRTNSVMAIWRYVWPVSSFLLVMGWVTLEVRRLFHAPDGLHSFQMSTAENYTYSAVWLLFALGLLAGGIVTRKAQLRYAALIVLLIVVLKVFLLDMAELSGLFRVASFLGLGLCLVGIGFIYQRFVNTGSSADAAEDKSPAT